MGERFQNVGSASGPVSQSTVPPEFVSMYKDPAQWAPWQVASIGAHLTDSDQEPESQTSVMPGTELQLSRETVGYRRPLSAHERVANDMEERLLREIVEYRQMASQEEYAREERGPGLGADADQDASGQGLRCTGRLDADRSGRVLRADAPPFVPGGSLRADAPSFVPADGLRADAPAFVPASGASSLRSAR